MLLVLNQTMKFSTRTRTLFIAVAVMACTTACYCFPAVVRANEPHRRRIRTRRTSNVDVLDVDALFWAKESRMVGSVEGAVTSSDSDSGSGSGSGSDDTVATATVGDLCPTHKHKPIDTESVRAALKQFVDSLDNKDDTLDDIEPSRRERGYHPKAEDQSAEYHICTVVQQCLDPPFMLSLGYMSPKQRGLAYKALSKATSQETFTMVQLQQHSNMLLGEMQDWATTCDGTCRELNDPNGLLEPVSAGAGSLQEQSTAVPSTSYYACGDLRAAGNWTFWYCNEEPRMVHEANIDVISGKYRLGNIWAEPHIHGRNSQYDYFSVYGDVENKKGGAFGLRFSGHHLDLNFEWNDQGKLVNDIPVFLGHNPLIVPATIPPQTRGFNDRLEPDHSYNPLMWTNMAGVAQFAESVQLVLDAANELLDIAPESYVPLSEWKSTGETGSLTLKDKKEVTDYQYFDLSTATESEFNTLWALVEYTLTFSRGNGSTQVERDLFRAQGKAIWTTSSPPEEGLPLNEEDLRSNLNFLNLRIDTDELMFFVMVNQMFTVISENEPTNHLHSVIIPKALLSPDHTCSEKDNPLCLAPPQEDDDHDDHDDDEHPAETISNTFKYESLMWEQRNLEANITLDVEGFDASVQQVSDVFCGLGMTATLFDENADQVFQKSYGSNYYSTGSYLNHSIEETGWTGDTTMSLYSNSKMVTSFTFLASVVETGLGYLDEPIFLTFPDILTADDPVGKATPRMIMSHSSNLPMYDRYNKTDPYYACKYDVSTTLFDCLKEHSLKNEFLIGGEEPGMMGNYNNVPWDVLAEVMVRKTGLDNYGDIIKKYVTEPIGMDNTSIDCPLVESTSEKPHVSWGFCSTAHDMAKLVQVLANHGSTKGGTPIISARLVQEIFSRGGGVSRQAMQASPLPFPLQMTRCYGELDTENVMNNQAIIGYGLGTMFFAGAKGHWFAHAGYSGGLWIVAPGKWSAYIGWMGGGADFNPLSRYRLVFDIFDKLEQSSTFMVRKGVDLIDLIYSGTDDLTSNATFEEIDALCGGDGLYLDLYAALGIESMYSLEPGVCPTQEPKRALHEKAELYQQHMESFRNLL